VTLNLAALQGTKLQLAKDTPTMPSLIVDVYGPSGSGKSHFALTAPGPISVSLFGAKNELDGTVQKFEADKEVVIGRYIDAAEQPAGGKNQNMEFFSAQNARFEKEVQAAMKAGVRSVVYDKGTDLWESIRYANFGAAATTGDYYRTIANREWSRLVQMVVQAGKNLVLIHEDDAEWGDTGERDEKTGKPKRQPTGRRIRKGNEKTGFLVDVTLRAFRDKAKFYYEIVEAKKAPHLNGEVHEGLDFATLAMMVKPNVDPSVWF
jgi:hypothetical protein